MEILPENQTSTQRNNVPGQPLAGLTIQPYGVEVFTDILRRKSFVVLFYRHDGGPHAKVLAWIGDVLDDLTRAGIHVSDAVKSRLTPDQHKMEPATPDTRYRCHLKVPVTPLAAVAADRQAFIDAIRSHFSKG